MLIIVMGVVIVVLIAVVAMLVQQNRRLAARDLREEILCVRDSNTERFLPLSTMQDVSGERDFDRDAALAAGAVVVQHRGGGTWRLYKVRWPG